MNNTGIVVIGRNEGRRLEACLSSVAGKSDTIVYVDSGSTDGSVEFANSLGVNVVELDMSIPFTAARARNAGFGYLRQFSIDSFQYVQFLDGDCTLQQDWLTIAQKTLDTRPNVAIVAGRVRERHPSVSVYNRLCDIEWNGRMGEVNAVGGIFMIRRGVFESVGGLSETIIAAEDTELCLRVRLAGWKILAVPEEMAIHDAAMLHFWQWWRRTTRCGHAYAEGYWTRRHLSRSYFRRELISAMLGGIGIPMMIVLLFQWLQLWSLLFVSFYLKVGISSFRQTRAKGYSRADAFWYALSIAIGKLPQAIGACKFFFNSLLRRQSIIIEHKIAPRITGKNQSGLQ